MDNILLLVLVAFITLAFIVEWAVPRAKRRKIAETPEANLNFAANGGSERYNVARAKDAKPIEVALTKLDNGRTIINVGTDFSTRLTLVVTGKIEVWDSWEWGAG